MLDTVTLPLSQVCCVIDFWLLSVLSLGWGRFFASFCAIFGVLIMFVLTAIIAINSAVLYRKEKERGEIDEYKKVCKSTLKM